jgi:hypothetical protein
MFFSFSFLNVSEISIPDYIRNNLLVIIAMISSVIAILGWYPSTGVIGTFLVYVEGAVTSACIGLILGWTGSISWIVCPLLRLIGWEMDVVSYWHDCSATQVGCIPCNLFN